MGQRPFEMPGWGWGMGPMGIGGGGNCRARLPLQPSRPGREEGGHRSVAVLLDFAMVFFESGRRPRPEHRGLGKRACRTHHVVWPGPYFLPWPNTELSPEGPPPILAAAISDSARLLIRPCRGASRHSCYAEAGVVGVPGARESTEPHCQVSQWGGGATWTLRVSWQELTRHVLSLPFSLL